MSTRDYNESFPNNRLKMVACELRFPTLLRISNNIQEFQEKIRDKLPDIEIGFPIPLDRIGVTKPTELSEWVFFSNKKISQLKVGINKIAYVVGKYSNFNDFFEQTIYFFNEFIDVFSIDYVLRVGLRYTNNIILEGDIYENKTFEQFFKPLINSKMVQSLKPFNLRSEIRRELLDDFKITTWNDLSLNPEGIYKYIIDIDVYTETKVQKENIADIIKESHELANIEFHSNITDDYVEVLRGN